jgi:hypothetical protein
MPDDGTLTFKQVPKETGSLGSSVSIVSDYRLDDQVTGVRPPTEAKDFSCSLCVQTSSEAHPASYPMDTTSKVWPGHDADHLPPSNAMVKNE